MSYQKEKLNLTSFIDCYWETHDLDNNKTFTYPSLPEPFINLFFPVQNDTDATIKGISSQTDFFVMKSKLFGVRIFLKGYYQLQLTHCSQVSNRIISLKEIGGVTETEMASSISKASTFEERIMIFRSYFGKKLKQPLNKIETDVAKAFQYLILNYKNPQIIKSYSEQTGNTPRTIHRWFY